VSDVTVIYNPASGSAPSEDELREAFAEFERGHRISFVPTTADDPGPGQTRAAIESGAECVIACGGDGTVRAVADALAGSGVHLGVVPFGTGNLLAKNVGLPEGFDAIPIAMSSSARKFDVGVINGERFAVMAGTGLDALMIRDASSTVKERVGSLAYVLSALRNLRAGQVDVEVTVDGSPWFSGPSAMVLIGNLGQITGGLDVFPDAASDDGLLDIAVLTPERARDWLTIGQRLVRNAPQPEGLVRRTQATDITIELAEPTPWELDGEDRDPTSTLTLGIERKALEVRC
jgi:diacylglycerol kinase (ATP)